MSNTTPESSGAAPESSSTASASEGLPVTPADILVEQSVSDELLANAVPEGTVSTADPMANPLGGAAESAALNLADVLPGVDVTDPNLGAYLKFETVDGNTVISLDADGAGDATPVTVVTLEGITGVTLQQLLNNGQDIT